MNFCRTGPQVLRKDAGIRLAQESPENPASSTPRIQPNDTQVICDSVYVLLQAIPHGATHTVAREDYYNLGVCSAPMREVLSCSYELRLQILQWTSIAKPLPALESRLMNKKHQFPLSNYTKSSRHTELRLKKQQSSLNLKTFNKLIDLIYTRTSTLKKKKSPKRLISQWKNRKFTVLFLHSCLMILLKIRFPGLAPDMPCSGVHADLHLHATPGKQIGSSGSSVTILE